MFPKGGMKGLMKQAQQMQDRMQKLQEEIEQGRQRGSKVLKTSLLSGKIPIVSRLSISSLQ